LPPPNPIPKDSRVTESIAVSQAWLSRPFKPAQLLLLFVFLWSFVVSRSFSHRRHPYRHSAARKW
jgi:hypothetical protein